MGDLTQKQENFCQKFVEIGNASEAYRQSYSAQNMSPESIWQEASTLKEPPHVSTRIKILQEEHVKRHAVTVDSLTKELEEARQLALHTTVLQPSAAVAATMGKAKIHGMLIDKSEHTGKDGKDLNAVVTVTVAESITKELVKKSQDEY